MVRSQKIYPWGGGSCNKERTLQNRRSLLLCFHSCDRTILATGVGARTKVRCADEATIASACLPLLWISCETFFDRLDAGPYVAAASAFCESDSSVHNSHSTDSATWLSSSARVRWTDAPARSRS